MQALQAAATTVPNTRGYSFLLMNLVWGIIGVDILYIQVLVLIPRVHAVVHRILHVWGLGALDGNGIGGLQSL